MTHTLVASEKRQVIIGFDKPFTIIGERINPTGRKKLAAEMIAGNFETVKADALAQRKAGAHILDVNAGVTAVNPNETEPPLLKQTIEIVQSVTDLPLCIDSSVSAALKVGLETEQPRTIELPIVTDLPTTDEPVDIGGARAPEGDRPGDHRRVANQSRTGGAEITCAGRGCRGPDDVRGLAAPAVADVHAGVEAGTVIDRDWRHHGRLHRHPQIRCERGSQWCAQGNACQCAQEFFHVALRGKPKFRT